MRRQARRRKSRPHVGRGRTRAKIITRGGLLLLFVCGALFIWMGLVMWVYNGGGGDDKGGGEPSGHALRLRATAGASSSHLERTARQESADAQPRVRPVPHATITPPQQLPSTLPPPPPPPPPPIVSGLANIDAQRHVVSQPSNIHHLTPEPTAQPPPSPPPPPPVADVCSQLAWQSKSGFEYNAFSGAVLYTFNRGLKLDASKIRVSLGGEEIPTVLGRSEDVEYPKYTRGAVTLPTRPNIQTKWYQRPFLESTVVGDVTNCDSAHTMPGTTVMVQRYEYANLWHTMTDWFNLHWTMEHLGGNVDRIIFLDGHAKGSLDEVWKTVFASDVRFVKRLPQQSICFERVILLPKATPLWNRVAPPKCTSAMDRFVTRVLAGYGVSRPARGGPQDDVAIKRGFYLAHPRVKRKSTVARGGWVPGQKQVPFHELTFKQQLETVVNAKTFSGIHGAGLTHLIWMGPGTKLVEWMPPSHRSVNLFKFIATWRPGVEFQRRPTSQLRSLLAKHEAQEARSAAVSPLGLNPRPRAPPLRGLGNHMLAIVIPFRDDGGRDKLAQGIGREQNLKEFEAYMCNFLKIPADIFVAEQSPRGTWNKGKLFNVGYHLSKPDHDYMVLHDVDQVPENPKNDYAWRDRPALLCAATSQWKYERRNPGVVGGALQISHADYAKVGGYSNVFEGWGREDDNMALRLKKHMGYDILSAQLGRYKELNHRRVWGLDETDQFKKNYQNSNDMGDGVQSVRYIVKKWTNTSCGTIRMYRALVDLL